MTQFPVVTQQGDDLLSPLQAILRGVNILPAEGDRVTLRGGTPDSVAIIEAGATALSKVWAIVVASLGGAGAIGAAVAGFWKSAQPSVQGRLVTASGAVVVAALVALAVIVAVDVYGRALGAAAQYRARAQLATTWIALAHQPLSPAESATPEPVSARSVLTGLAAGGRIVAVTKTAGGEAGHLGGIRRDADGNLLLRFVGESLNQNDWVSCNDIATFEFTY